MMQTIERVENRREYVKKELSKAKTDQEARTLNLVSRQVIESQYICIHVKCVTSYSRVSAEIVDPSVRMLEIDI